MMVIRNPIMMCYSPIKYQFYVYQNNMFITVLNSNEKDPKQAYFGADSIYQANKDEIVICTKNITPTGLQLYKVYENGNMKHKFEFKSNSSAQDAYRFYCR